jgi:hypothetical protein
MNGDSSATAATPLPARVGRPAWRTVARRPAGTGLVGEWVEPGRARAGD